MNAILVAAILAAFSQPEPLTSRCISIPPLCGPGKEPICLCESEISMRCRWICASHG